MEEVKKQFNERQTAFLAAAGDPSVTTIRAAMRMAGYSDTYKQSDLFLDKELEREYKARLASRMAANGLRAVHAQEQIFENPAMIGAATLRQTATDVLDRMGLGKQDSLEVTVKQPDGLLILPDKKEPEIAEDCETEV